MKELTQELLEQAVTNMIGKEATEKNLKEELKKLNVNNSNKQIKITKETFHNSIVHNRYKLNFKNIENCDNVKFSIWFDIDNFHVNTDVDSNEIILNIKGKEAEQ